MVYLTEMEAGGAGGVVSAAGAVLAAWRYSITRVLASPPSARKATTPCVLTGTATVPLLIALSAVNGVVSALALPATAAILPETVPEDVRQQANAVVAARTRIVYGAVSMVQMALDELKKQGVVELDEERRAAMVSNLLVVLCSDRASQPVINTGSIY